MAEAMEAPLLSDRTAEEALRPLKAVCIAFIIIDTLFVLARAYSRQRIAKLPFWWDDFWVIPAWLTVMGLASLGLYMTHIEIIYDNEDRIILNLEELSYLLKAIFAFLQLLLPSFAATRFSILALYLRIFSDKGVRRATWVACGIITLQYLAFALAAIFMCKPVEYFWNRGLATGGTCINVDSFYRSVTIPNIIMDVAIIVLPIPTVWRLKSSNVRKWALTFVFCLGTMALVASCIRLWIYETHTGEILAPQYTNVLISWLVVEPSIYLIAACLPAMHHFFAAISPQFVHLWYERRMAAMKHPLSRTAAQEPGVSHPSNGGKQGIYGDFSRLTDDNDDLTIREGNVSSVHAEAKGAKKKNNGKLDHEVYEMEQGLGQGIMVTTEVIITQEERIADVIGF